MKLLITLLLILTTNCFAQFKVEIVNSENQSMSQDCEDEAKCNAYIARVEHKWGKKQRWQKETCKKESDLIETRDITMEQPIYDTREVEVLNEETGETEIKEESYESGTETIAIGTEYHCKQNYSVTVTDISEEIAAKAAKKVIDDARKEEIKSKAKNMKLEELIELLELKGVI